MFTIKKIESFNKTIRMPDYLINQLEELSSKSSISFNQLVIQCCEYAISHLENSISSTYVESTQDFINRKKQIKAEFLDYMSKKSNASISSISQIFTDAIYVTQPRNKELNIDFHSLLTSEITIENYQQSLESYFYKNKKKNPVDLSKNYIYCFTLLKKYLEETSQI